MNGTDLRGRVALVTGAGSGIGRATALGFAAAGAKVVAADIALANAEETVSQARAKGGEAIAVKTDVSVAASVEALMARTLDAYGRLDCAVNNAGVNGTRAEFHELAESDWDRVVGINLKGVFLCMKYEIAQMLKTGGGAIVNTSSVAGLTGSRAADYGASKHGVVGLTRSAASHYSARGIRVNCVCPGAIDTPMTAGIPREKRLVGPVGRTAQPDEVAALMLWLCSDAASYVIGHAIPADGGWMIGGMTR